MYIGNDIKECNIKEFAMLINQSSRFSGRVTPQYAAINRSASSLNAQDMALSDKKLGRKILTMLANENEFKAKNLSYTYTLARELGQDVKKIWSLSGLTETPSEEVVTEIDMVIAAVLERENVIAKIKELSKMRIEIEKKYDDVISLDNNIKEIDKHIGDILSGDITDQDYILVDLYNNKKAIMNEAEIKMAEYEGEKYKFIMKVSDLDPFVANELAGRIRGLENKPNETSERLIQPVVERKTMRLFQKCISILLKPPSDIMEGAKESFTTASGRKNIGGNLVAAGMYTLLGLGLYALYEYAKEKQENVKEKAKTIKEEHIRSISEYKAEYQKIVSKYNNLSISNPIIQSELKKLTELMETALSPWENAVNNINLEGVRVFNFADLIFNSQKFQKMYSPRIIAQISKCNSLLDTANLKAKTSELIASLKRSDLDHLNNKEKEEFKSDRKAFKQAIKEFDNIDSATSVAEINNIYNKFESLREKLSPLASSKTIEIYDDLLQETALASGSMKITNTTVGSRE